MADEWEAAGFRKATDQPSSGKPADEWESAGFRAAQPTGTDNLKAMAKGAAGGLVEGAFSAGGAIAGGMMGAPAGPVGIAAGATLGGTAGMLAGRGYRRRLGTDVSEFPDESRPYYVAGETFGAGVPFALSPVALGKMGAKLPNSIVGNFLNRTFKTASEKTKSFLAVELSALASAGVGASIAEDIAPGNPFVRLGGELVGGIASPAIFLSLAGQGFKLGLAKVAANFTKQGRQNSAQRALRDIVEAAGEDPDALAALLRDPRVTGNPTPAQRTGSLALSAIEAKIAKENLKFGQRVAQRGQEALDSIENSISLLRRTGDPEAFREAAVQRSRQYKAMLGSLVRSAENDAAAAARGISPDSESARATISNRAREALDTVLGEARKAESELWEKIPRETPANTQLIQDAYRNITRELLPEEVQEIPRIARDFVQRMQDQGNTTNVGEVLLFRSRMLALAREAGGKGDWNDARIYGQLAEASLDDLSRARLQGLPPFLIDDAREFSLALNDTFTRSFAGKAMGKSGSGAERVPPELLLRRALATGGEAAELQFRELEEATTFMRRVGADSALADSAIDQMVEAQERFLRLTAARAIDPATGRASSRRLADILRKEQALFDRFPAARQAVEAAISSEDRLKDLERITTNASRVVSQQAAFSKVANFDSPADAISKAVRSPKPSSEINAMAKLARRGGPEAMAGMRASILDYAFGQSGPEFRPDRVRAALFDPVTPGKPSVLDIAKSNRIVSDSDIANIKQLLDKADNIVSARTGRADLVQQAEQMDGLTELILRIQGAKMGTALSGGGPMQGHGLIAAQAGSSYVRKLFQELDVGSTEKVLIEAVENPEFMAKLLETPATGAAALDLGMQIHAWLIQSGFRFSAEMSEMGYESLVPRSEEPVQ